MSRLPHYTYLRKGKQYGELGLKCGLKQDGLTDSFEGKLMGECVEKVAAQLEITRQAQDQEAILSYEKAR